MPTTASISQNIIKRRRRAPTRLSETIWPAMFSNQRLTTIISDVLVEWQNARHSKAGRTAMRPGERSSRCPKELLHERRNNCLCNTARSDDLPGRAHYSGRRIGFSRLRLPCTNACHAAGEAHSRTAHGAYRGSYLQYKP